MAASNLHVNKSQEIKTRMKKNMVIVLVRHQSSPNNGITTAQEKREKL